MKFRKDDKVKLNWDAIAEEERDKFCKYLPDEGIVRNFYYNRNMCSVMLPDGSIYYLDTDFLINISKGVHEFIEKLFDDISI